MAESLRIITTGLIGQYPLGGVAWDYIQYVLGFRRLGHDVYYFEDTGQSPYVPKLGGLSKDSEYTVSYLADLMEHFGLTDRWAYHFPYPTPQWFGLSDHKRREIVESADLVVNISGTLARPEEYRSAKRMAFIDSDPVFTQVKLARGHRDLQDWIDVHDICFSFGETLPGNAPATDYTWHPTRQPIVLDEWPRATGGREVLTTVMNWTSYKSLEHEGQTFGQKDMEFVKFLDLPGRVSPVELEIAVNEGKTKRAPRELLAHKGWHVVNPDDVCGDFKSYRAYLSNSKAEWSVAKNGYVVGRCGWFSCRSACYLAAGRPVVVQSTGFESVLPSDLGILAFTDIDSATRCIESLFRDYPRHSDAAVDIAKEYFDSDRVLQRIIDTAGAAPTEH
ncbi:MAG TPA: hypothetical protein VMO47_02960 [Rhodothermales bacterium]|nr:hypothetical protein [Rhodothermales bacterium]